MFEHSIKVPRLYKTAAQILRKVKENNGSLKNLVYEKKFDNIKAIYALIVTTLKYAREIDFLLKKTQLLEKEQRLDPTLARILISELLWGKKALPGESKPIKTILSYEQILKAHISDVSLQEPKAEKVLKPRYVRVNTILTTVSEVVEGFRDEGWTFVRFMDPTDYNGFISKVSSLGPEEFMVDIHIKELLIFPPNTQFYKHNAYRDGLIILQDKSSCLPVHFLDPQPGSTVLDMCAAPGMKTSQIAAKINNEGKVFAVDKDVARLKTLNELMEKSSITCVTSINKDILQVTDADCPNVEYILVDPSCSGTGIVDRMDFSKGNTSNDDFRIKKLAGFQIMILKHAVRKFPKAKRIVYSTCSLDPRENEAVVQEVISMCPVFKLVPAGKFFKSKWNNFGAKEYGEIGRRCIYTRPETDLTNGFFVAVFERLEEGEQNEFLVQKTVNKELTVEENKIHDCNAAVSNPNDSMNRTDSNYFEETNNSGVLTTNKQEASKKKKKGKKDITKESENLGIEKSKTCSMRRDSLKSEEIQDQIPKEKNKKSNAENTTAEEMCLTNSTEYASEEQFLKKKKKKSKHKSTSESLFNLTTTTENNSEEVEMDNAHIPTKKKKKSKTDNTLEVESNPAVTDKIENEECTPKKKKKSKSNTENNVDEMIIEITASNQADKNLVKKKKKKYETKNTFETDINIITNENANGEHITKKKKKKFELESTSESLSNLTNTSKNNLGEIEMDNENIPKKKKSKTDNTLEVESNPAVVDRIENEEYIPKRKKKSKSNTENNVDEAIIEVTASGQADENLVKKKKKKDETRNAFETDINTVTNENANGEHIIKKKKKSKETAENSIDETNMENTVNHEIDEHIVKKKKKKSKTEDNVENDKNLTVNNENTKGEHNTKKMKNSNHNAEYNTEISPEPTLNDVAEQTKSKKRKRSHEECSNSLNEESASGKKCKKTAE